MNVTEVTTGMALPLLDDYPPIPTRPLSSLSSGFGDKNSSPTPMAIRGTMEDSPMATSLGNTVMDPSRPSSNHSPGLHTSGARLPNSTSNEFKANFTHEATPSNFRLDRQGSQIATTSVMVTTTVRLT